MNLINNNIINNIQFKLNVIIIYFLYPFVLFFFKFFFSFFYQLFSYNPYFKYRGQQANLYRPKVKRQIILLKEMIMRKIKIKLNYEMTI